MAALFVIVLFLSFEMGRYNVSLIDVIRNIISDGFNLDKLLSRNDMNTFFRIRLPRVLIGILAGGMLSLSGCSYQGIFRNPLASPDLLGVTAGASFGAALLVELGGTGAEIQIAAFGFGIAAVLMTVLASSAVKNSRGLYLILFGITVTAFFTAALQIVQMIANPTTTIQQIRFWLMGSLASSTYRQLLYLLIALLLAGTPLLALRWRLNLLAFGDEEARSMGINVAWLRGAVIICSTVLTASVIAVCGTIGWVGLIIPHLMRLMTGSDYKTLLPASFIGGAVFLLLADDLARTLFPFELPVGMITSIVGMSLYVIIAVKERRHAAHAS